MDKAMEGLRVAVLATDGCEQTELTAPVKALRQSARRWTSFRPSTCLKIPLRIIDRKGPFRSRHRPFNLRDRAPEPLLGAERRAQGCRCEGGRQTTVRSQSRRGWTPGRLTPTARDDAAPLLRKLRPAVTIDGRRC